MGLKEKNSEVYRKCFQQKKLEKLRKFRGSFKADKDLVRKIAQDEEIAYVRCFSVERLITFGFFLPTREKSESTV